MTSKLVTVLAVIVTLGWMAVVGMSALNSWPRIPLDMSSKDPATRAAYDKAVTVHVLSNALAASVPLVFLGIGYWISSRRKGP